MTPETETSENRPAASEKVETSTAGRPQLLVALLPRWQSHKVVRAAKIIQVFRDDVMEVDLRDQRTGLRMCIAPADKMFSRYRPVPGDYYVVYDDGYASISPREAFESGYHRL